MLWAADFVGGYPVMLNAAGCTHAVLIWWVLVSLHCVMMGKFDHCEGIGITGWNICPSRKNNLRFSVRVRCSSQLLLTNLSPAPPLSINRFFHLSLLIIFRCFFFFLNSSLNEAFLSPTTPPPLPLKTGKSGQFSSGGVKMNPAL